MGLLSAIGRFFQRLFGIGEGALNNASDKMVTANEATIRGQFRKVRDQWIQDHSTVRTAVANLMAINEEKKNETIDCTKKLSEIEVKKLGAVRKFKETNDMKYQDLFKEFTVTAQRLTEKVQQNNEFVATNTENIEKYKRQLVVLQTKIEELKQKEDQAVADITSSRQVVKLNEMLSGLSTDVNMQGIQAIEEARKKSLANAKLSTELSGVSKREIDEELLAAGSNVDEEFAQLLAKEEEKMTKDIAERNL
jgi:phage shock protein A